MTKITNWTRNIKGLATFFFRKKGSILRQTSRFWGKRAFSEANESYDFPHFSHSISSFLHPLPHPLEPGAISAKSGTVYNHPNHVTRPEPIRKKSGKRRSFEESPWSILWRRPTRDKLGVKFIHTQHHTVNESSSWISSLNLDCATWDYFFRYQ